MKYLMLILICLMLSNCKMETRSYTVVERNVKGDTIQIYTNVKSIYIRESGVLSARLLNGKCIGVSNNYTYEQN